MDSHWAAENLQVIRTLMERSSLYRRALAPVMLFAGVIGVIASAGALLSGIETSHGFTRFWIAVGVVAVSGVFLLMRRQALKDVEPFWSPPTRRVVQGLTPPLLVGFAIAIPFLFREQSDPLPVWWLVPGWFALYGCALCSAGFFMPRGIKIFGWFFVVAGAAVYLYSTCVPGAAFELSFQQAHVLMGSGFGVLHLLYGSYLYVTEKKRKNAA